MKYRKKRKETFEGSSEADLHRSLQMNHWKWWKAGKVNEYFDTFKETRVNRSVQENHSWFSSVIWAKRSPEERKWVGIKNIEISSWNIEISSWKAEMGKWIFWPPRKTRLPLLNRLDSDVGKVSVYLTCQQWWSWQREWIKKVWGESKDISWSFKGLNECPKQIYWLLLLQWMKIL